MWLLNKDTGIEWEVTDIELIQRLIASGRYEKAKQNQTDELSPAGEKTEPINEAKMRPNAKRQTP